MGGQPNVAMQLTHVTNCDLAFLHRYAVGSPERLIKRSLGVQRRSVEGAGL